MAPPLWNIHDSPWNKDSDEEFLRKIDAVVYDKDNGRYHPTLAGLLFFGEFVDIVRTMPNFMLDYREYYKDGTFEWTDRISSSKGSWTGNIFDFYTRVVPKLTQDIKIPLIIKGFERIEDTPVHKAVREVLANALIHADYYGRQGVVITKSLNNITAANPGSFRIPVEKGNRRWYLRF